ncbi:MAG TPA: aldolase/citrate lyase family protein [Thermoflexales bacterium]|nr:aldolase/citrate lyase family protein [Thermoflexales bacterium]HQZ52904.1 aldolase/citrate lyase family protein [Thermoflexales bacterium]HRA52900.1 aldolase/citrate lyase family protein [Thermoflexales bacterium]
MNMQDGRPINSAKRKMLNGEPALGTSCVLGSNRMVETLSFGGFDFVMIDLQHGDWTDHTAGDAFRYINLGPATPMARVGRNDFGAIGRLLDRGALGIIVPMVNTEADAQAAAHAMRFPPYGGRSYGGAPTHYGNDYEAWVDNEAFLAVQIESAEAVRNAEAILSVPGVDGCWIGPADMAKTMGIDRNAPADAKAHLDAILSVRDACRKTGKICGISGGYDISFWLQNGFQFVTISADIGLMMEGAKVGFELAGKKARTTTV